MEIITSATLVRQAHGRATFTGIYLPAEHSDLLDDLPIPRGGFGSIKVHASVGDTEWTTSLFPTPDGFLLLIARKVLEAERLAVGRPVSARLRVLAV